MLILDMLPVRNPTPVSTINTPIAPLDARQMPLQPPQQR